MRDRAAIQREARRAIACKQHSVDRLPLVMNDAMQHFDDGFSGASYIAILRDGHVSAARTTSYCSCGRLTAMSRRALRYSLEVRPASGPDWSIRHA
uniref:Uncharacterized protein n=1 Tax=Mycobacterium leprae TaxID=1769 RepID=O07153_MYCLR|nr:hypothetical protein MLCL581.19c [Mycobacterium leprae]